MHTLPGSLPVTWQKAAVMTLAGPRTDLASGELAS
jgi:hypothetical protein